MKTSLIFLFFLATVMDAQQSENISEGFIIDNSNQKIPYAALDIRKKIGDTSYDGVDLIIIEGIDKKKKKNTIKLYVGLETFGVYKI